MNKNQSFPPGFHDLHSFPLITALLGRRSRRFFMGAEIIDGVFSFKSQHDTVPLSELETLLIITACSGNTSWNHLIYRAQEYAPHLSNYAAAASGRTIPSAAGFHTSNCFFTDDTGVYFFNTRDLPSLIDKDEKGTIDIETLLSECKKHIQKLESNRLILPPVCPFVEPHNTWVVNHPGTLLVIPVGDLAQHVLLGLCYMLQNGLVLFDDINRRPIPGINYFDSIVNTNNTWPVTFVEQLAMAEVTAELSMTCFSGTLMLQAMGLGGWMFDGMDPFSVLGASGDQQAPSLRFSYTTNDNWPYPNPNGLKNVMEGFCPPFYQNMKEAVEAVVERKFGKGGPFNPETPGPWKNSREVRSAAQIHDTKFKECVALQAQYIYDTFGKFPGTVPSMFAVTYLQAHHLDLDFYDHFYKPGSYLRTHQEHMNKWH